MGKYSGLDKADTRGLFLVKRYGGARIYRCTNEGFLVIKRGYLVDCQFSTLEDCEQCIDHFNED